MRVGVFKQRQQSFLWLCIVCITIITGFTNVSMAAGKEAEEPKVVVIYTTKDEEMTKFERYLDLLIGHFTSDIRFVSSNEVKKSDLTSVTHLFYYSRFAANLPQSFLTLFDEFEGSFVAIGYNSEKLGDKFNFVEVKDEIYIDQMLKTSSNEKVDITKMNLIHIEAQEESEVLIKGSMKEDHLDYPVMVKKDNYYYYGFDFFDSSQSTLFAEVLHEVFQANHEKKNTGYIRLEDVHPLVDPKPLKEIANILKEKDIPYMVAVIPIYTNPNTGKRHSFADSPELLKVLKQIQKDGGSIVLHGYTHQFRASETGEGFEFWDVKNNSPIYAPADQEFTIKKEHHFSSSEEYENYINDLKAYEREYTETKINKGIDELAKYGLYPLAFEAPHYTVSQHGYQILSEYFSTYVGQVQLSDEDWEIMDTAPFITSPSFLHGMELLPETMGYVQPEDEQSIQKMISNANRNQLTQDGMLAAFYHPYLGVERFQELIVELEQFSNVSWIDLKEMDVWVKGTNVSIKTKNGEIITDFNRFQIITSTLEAPLYYFRHFASYALWAMVFVGSATVFAFITFTIYLKSRKKHIGSE